MIIFCLKFLLACTYTTLCAAPHRYLPYFGYTLSKKAAHLERDSEER